MAIGTTKSTEFAIANGTKVRGGNRPIISAPQPKSPTLPLNWAIRLPIFPARSVFMPQTPISAPTVNNPNRVTFGNFSNTKNTGLNRAIYNQSKSIGEVIIDSPGLLPTKNMREGNFNFATGQFQQNSKNLPGVLFSKNRLYDNTNQSQRPTINTGSPNMVPFITTGASGIDDPTLPQFFPLTNTPDKCVNTWICIKDF